MWYGYDMESEISLFERKRSWIKDFSLDKTTTRRRKILENVVNERVIFAIPTVNLKFLLDSSCLIIGMHGLFSKSSVNWNYSRKNKNNGKCATWDDEPKITLKGQMGQMVFSCKCYLWICCLYFPWTTLYTDHNYSSGCQWTLPIMSEKLILSQAILVQYSEITAETSRSAFWAI